MSCQYLGKPRTSIVHTYAPRSAPPRRRHASEATNPASVHSVSARIGRGTISVPLHPAKALNHSRKPESGEHSGRARRIQHIGALSMGRMSLSEPGCALRVAVRSHELRSTVV
jgi:hypothetical protein